MVKSEKDIKKTNNNNINFVPLSLMKCKVYPNSETYDEYLLGRMKEDLMDEFEKHFFSCSVCGEELSFRRKLIESLIKYPIKGNTSEPPEQTHQVENEIVFLQSETTNRSRHNRRKRGRKSRSERKENMYKSYLEQKVRSSSMHEKFEMK